MTNDDIKYRKPTPPTIPQYCYMDRVETFDCEECTGKDNKRKCVTKKCKSMYNKNFLSQSLIFFINDRDSKSSGSRETKDSQ